MRAKKELLALCVALLLGAGCAPSENDIQSVAGRDSMKTRALASLNAGECTEAAETVEDLVLSEFADNEARELYATALACQGGMTSILAAMLKVSDQAAGLTTALWQTLTEIHYDADAEELERNYTAGFLAQDRFMSVVRPGVTIGVSNRFDLDEWNPASLLMNDREESGRLVQLFLSMQIMGQVQAAKADPDPTNFQRQRRLGATSATGTGWSAPENIDETACGWAGAAVTMIEGISEVASMAPDSVTPTLNSIAAIYGDIMDDACDSACQGIADPGLGVDFTGNGCAFAAGDCRGTDSAHPCLLALRNRNFCATSDANTTLDDKARCAASGIAKIVNDSVIPLIQWAGSP
jgi:hypothetical protein